MGTEDGRAGLVEAHAAVSSRDDLIADRRSLYRFAISLAGIRSEPPNDTVDSPVSRAAVGRMLDGGAPIAASDLVDIGELCSDESRIADGSIGVAVASSANAQHHLQGALDIISGHAGGEASAPSDLALLTAVSDGFDRAVDTIADGFRLAMSRDRALLADLLPHVGLVVVLDRQTSGRLGSASAREFPGLVVLPDPTTAVEVAEALVHEAAHQKIFDMSITNDVIGVNAQGCTPFGPDWSPPGTAWPLEQVFAAWHAYTCLARFRDSLTPDDLAAIGRSSLLEHAADRAEQLGERLLCCGRHLGRDAHKLIESVLGVPPYERWVDDLASVYDGATHRDSGERVEVHRLPTRSRALAGWGGASPQVFWVESAVDGPTPR